MFNSVLTAEDKAAIELARAFASEFITEDTISQWYIDGGIPDSVMFAYKDCGLGTLGLSEEYGGLKTSGLAQIIIMEELSRLAGAFLPFIVQLYTFNAVSKFANEKQLRMLFEQFDETARVLYSTAISDSTSGSDISMTRTAVYERDGKLYLTGKKAFVTEGEHTPYIVVLAKDMTKCDDLSKAPLSLWLLPRGNDGIKILPIKKIGQKGVSSAAIVFTDSPVEQDWRFGKGDLDRKALMNTIEFGRCAICASSLGLAQAAFDDAASYAKNHIIRETPIGEYGQIQLMLTDMQSTLHNMRAHVYYATWALENNDRAVEETSLMKYYVPSAAVNVADMAMQLFGGVGYTETTRIGRIWSDCQGNKFATGTTQVMTILASREILGKH